MAKKDFEDVINLRILKRGDYPGLSKWALNEITCILLRERFDTNTHRKKAR